jgi:hexosaminidase
LLPRMLALSEIAWSPTSNKDYYNFSESRLPHRLQKLDAAGYLYRVPEPVGVEDTLMQGGTFRIVMKSPVEGAKIHYTIDGNAPRETDLWYTDPLKISVPEGKQVDLQTITITKTGKRSRITHTVLDNGSVKSGAEK